MTESKYTREEFVKAEIKVGIESQGLAGVDFPAIPRPWDECFSAATVQEIRQRAEWNAQAAERAGVVWRKPAPAVLWSSPVDGQHPAYRILSNGALQYTWDAKSGKWSDLSDQHPAMKELRRRLMIEWRAREEERCT